MADINYTLNLLFNETSLHIFQMRYGHNWYENELISSMREDYERDPKEAGSVKDYLLGKKKKADLDVTVLSRYLLFNDKYKNLITKPASDNLHILRKDRNRLGHELLTITEEDKRCVVRDIVNVYNCFSDIVYTSLLVNNINVLARLYGVGSVRIRTEKSNKDNCSSGDSGYNYYKSTSSQNTSTQEKHWWEKDTYESQRVNNQQQDNEGEIIHSQHSSYVNTNKNETGNITQTKTGHICYLLCVIVLIGYISVLVIYSNKPEIFLISTIIFIALIMVLKLIDSIIMKRINRKIVYKKSVSKISIEKNKFVNKREKVEKNKQESHQVEKVIYICPFCNKKVRVDKPKKHIIITCPNCKNEFDEKP
jgi:hypothetical protein